MVAAGSFLLTLVWPDLEASLAASDPAIHRPDFPDPIDAAAGVAPRRGSLSCSVTFVPDGDSLGCRDGTRIRLHAIAARERDGTCSPGHPCPRASAQAATSALRRLAAGKTISCEPVGQSYDRITAICWTPGGEEINCAMIRSGTTELWDRFNREAAVCRS